MYQIYQKSKTATLALRKKIFWSLIVCMSVLIGLYGYFVSTSIVNVLVREDIEYEIQDTNASIGELEFAYLHKKNDITIELAHRLGFYGIEGKSFVTRKSLAGARVSLNDE